MIKAIIYTLIQIYNLCISHLLEQPCALLLGLFGPCCYFFHNLASLVQEVSVTKSSVFFSSTDPATFSRWEKPVSYKAYLQTKQTAMVTTHSGQGVAPWDQLPVEYIQSPSCYYVQFWPLGEIILNLVLSDWFLVYQRGYLCCRLVPMWINFFLPWTVLFSNSQQRSWDCKDYEIFDIHAKLWYMLYARSMTRMSSCWQKVQKLKLAKITGSWL